MGLHTHTNESYMLFEEELTTKLHSSFVERFDLDKGVAAELAHEILELLHLSNSNISEVNSLYI